MYYDVPALNTHLYLSSSNAISFTMNGKPKSGDLKKMLEWLDECRQIVSQELESPSTLTSGWTVNLRLERHGTTPTDSGMNDAMAKNYYKEMPKAEEVKING